MINLVCFAVVASALNLNTPTIDPPSDLKFSLKVVLEQFRTEYGFPGATAAVILADGSSATTAVGLADVQASQPMTEDTKMLAASIGKTFVAATAIALEAEGGLALDDLVSEHLGNEEWFSEIPNAREMTIRHLLRHESGLPDHVHLPEFQAEASTRIRNNQTALTALESIGYVFSKEPLFKPGTSWSYSDTGYLLLGLAIEKATGRDYYQVVEERFLLPLGLSSTVPSDRQEIDGLAVGYTVEDNAFGLPARTADLSGRLYWDPSVEWTGGGLASTSRDLATWGHALFTGQALESPYLSTLFKGVPTSPDSAKVLYGTGVAIYKDTSRGTVYGHGGWIPGYVSSLRHYADHSVTISFQINTDVGVVDDSTDLVPALEAALADWALQR
jgi:D-alanyl-D-alanine carboxypeptidase